MSEIEKQKIDARRAFGEDDSIAPVWDRVISPPMQRQLEHGQAVSNLALLVGKEMGLEDSVCHDLAVAGFFHDIGKTELTLPEEISDNPLVVEELNYVRRHPAKGAQILERHGYSEDICQAVLYHHENYDGSGYPDHLEGWNIPLGACVLRVCDVYCSLIEDRPHRKAFTPPDAFDLMREEIRNYDLRVFLALQRVLHNEEGEIRVPEITEEAREIWRESCH